MRLSGECWGAAIRPVYNRPDLVAMTTAEVLLFAPIFRMALLIWKFTVRVVRLRIMPMSKAVFPSAVHFSTSDSRAESRWGWACSTWRGKYRVVMQVCNWLHNHNTPAALSSNSSSVSGVQDLARLKILTTPFVSCTDCDHP